MSVEAAIRKAKKLIAEREARTRVSTVFESHDGLFPPKHIGLVILYSQETREEAMTA